MSNALYGLGKEAYLTGGLDWNTDAVHVMLVRTVAGSGAGGNSVYTVSINADQYLSAVPNNAYCQVADVALTSLSSALGVANAATATFTSVASGDAIQALVIYKSTGTQSTSPLIAYIDTATGLPVTPNGANITVTWDTGANKIFAL